MTSRQLRTKLDLTRVQWAQALGIHERTVSRWEDKGVEPHGLPCEVMRGIAEALERGAEPARVSRMLRTGLGALIADGLLYPMKPTNKPPKRMTP